MAPRRRGRRDYLEEVFQETKVVACFAQYVTQVQCMDMCITCRANSNLFALPWIWHCQDEHVAIFGRALHTDFEVYGPPYRRERPQVYITGPLDITAMETDEEIP